MEVRRVGDLEISQDSAFQHREWVVQRVGWVIWLAVIGAALIGLMGAGPMPNATAGAEGDPLRVQYERFVRHSAPEKLEIALQPGAVQGKQARVWIDREYVEGLQVQNITPEPSSVEAGPDRMTYVFDLERTGEPTTITFDLQHDDIGRRTARVGLGDREVLRFDQFIYP